MEKQIAEVCKRAFKRDWQKPRTESVKCINFDAPHSAKYQLSSLSGKTGKLTKQNIHEGGESTIVETGTKEQRKPHLSINVKTARYNKRTDTNDGQGGTVCSRCGAKCQ